MARWLRWYILAALIAAGVIFVQAHSADVAAARDLLNDARPLPLAAAVAFQFLYYFFAALVLREALRLVDFEAPFGWTLRAAFLLIFISRMVPGPAAAGPAALYYLLERRGLSKARSALVGPIFYAVDFGIFFILLAVGLGALVLRGDTVATAAAAPVLIVAALIGAWLAWLIHHPHRLEASVETVVRVGNGILRTLHIPWRAPGNGAARVAGAVRDARQRLRRHPGIGIRLVISGVAMLLSDVAGMTCCFLAFGVWNGISTSFLGFCIATSGALVSVLPGGLGTFDAAMVFGFTVLGAPRAQTLAATVVYRLLATWLPAALGFFAARALLGSAVRLRRTV